jgi:hypothetical protein
MPQEVKHLPSRHEALSSIPRTAKKRILNCKKYKINIPYNFTWLIKNARGLAFHWHME